MRVVETAGRPDVVVIGHAGRDLVLAVDDFPPAGGTVAARQRLERPGGKGYNQAMALAQLGRHPALLAAVGDDRAGDWVRSCARRDGIDADGVVARPGSATSLVVSVVRPGGSWRYVEDLPRATFVQPDDIEANRSAIESAAVTSVQLQEPGPAVAAAARLARGARRMVVADGAPEPEAADELLTLVDLLRADQHEAGLLSGIEIADGSEALRAARTVRGRGPRVVILAAGPDGNAVVGPDGEAVIPFADEHVADSTGAGDALVAGTISGILSGDDPIMAACVGAAAAAALVTRIGGRPTLDRERVRADAARLRQRVGRGSGRC